MHALVAGEVKRTFSRMSCFLRHIFGGATAWPRQASCQKSADFSNVRSEAGVELSSPAGCSGLRRTVVLRLDRIAVAR
jgi:hypothetical protein